MLACHMSAESISRVFLMRLRPGALPEYTRYHEEVWPELEEEIRASGIERFQIFEADPILVVVSELREPDAWARLWNSPLHRRWGELMEPLLEFGDDGLIDSSDMNEIYRFPPATAG
jgi:L-rhamnose mutarotase